ncbi:MAG: hypothetical protein GF317_24180 [Candidatus Lokiarchaeota archaeon]|nr:hypothetical protein [Candidatus Lokiarchaeota archaeon]MBD3202472.1 hypothetical protein [Candidatus Lokiarchaeota archaeon]
MNSLDDIIKRVKKILIDVKTETDELGLFARKWVEKTFAKRCGMKIDKFLDLIEELENQIDNSELNIDWYATSLTKLASYFDQNIENAKGWIKDPDELEKAIKVLQERK